MANASLLHEAPLEILRDDPNVVLDLLAIAGQRLREGPHFADPIDPSAQETVPSHRSADFVALIRPLFGAHVELVVVVEAQRTVDPDKAYAWPQYVATLAARHRAPVLLLVWAFDPSVASWARGPWRVGPSMVLSPTVIGPADLPRFRTIEEARQHVALAMLGALTRLGRRGGNSAAEKEVLRTAEAILDLDPERRRLYASLLHGAASGRLRGILERFLEVHGMRALELIRKEGWEEGRETGREEGREEGLREGLRAGRASALLHLLESRGFEVDEALQARVRATTEDVLLDRWLERVLTASSVDEVFSATDAPLPH